MRGEFFIDGDTIFLFPQKCVVSLGASNVPSELGTHGVGIPKQPFIPSMTISHSSNAPLASLLHGANTIEHSSQSISLISLNNSIVSSQSANKFSFALVMPGTELVRHPINLVSKMTFNISNNTSPLIIPSTNNAKQPLINPALPLLKAKSQSASNFPSALIMTGAELKRQLIESMPATTLNKSHCRLQSAEMSQAELKKQLIHSNTIKSTYNFQSAVVMSGARLKEKFILPKPATALSQVLFNNIQKKSCQGANNGMLKNPEPFVEGPIQSSSSSIICNGQSSSNVDGSLSSIVMSSSPQDDVFIQDSTDLIATNETETSSKMSSPKYLKSQKGGTIMYYSSYLYATNRKNQDKIYYRCHNYSCLATAIDINGFIVVNHRHNHDPPREEYEAMVTRDELKKAAAANPSQKLSSVYKETLSSRLSEVPDLGNFPKATPSLRSVRMTMRRALRKRHPRLLCKKNNIRAVSIEDANINGGTIMYYSSYLYMINRKSRDKIYYRCHNSSCQTTASEVNGRVVVNYQHNHDPPREVYEALVTKEKLKKAVVANPTQKISNVYYETLSSRLSEVPDLGDYPKATPLFRSVISTMKRAIKARQPSPLCRSKVQRRSQSSPQNQIIEPLPKRNKLIN